jgi:DNA invertase Pin-like site-specific DNA recombinase
MDATKVSPEHLRRSACLYVRQSTLRQVEENRESTARQYDLRRRAEVLGWKPEQILVIDEDLGLSAAGASDRTGFQRMVAEVGLGQVGLVLGLEVSRLARSSSDWHRLLEICALTETLILDEDGLYDPSHYNDRLLLGLKGTMSEAELHVLRARLWGGQLNKARRGELWIRPPLGYVHDEKGRLVLDPDQQIQSLVQLLFETFKRTGSARQVVKHFEREGILWPRRLRSGPHTGEMIWRPLGAIQVLSVLHNPRYTGAFVFGRSRRRGGPGSGRLWKLPREQWKVFLPDTHPAYLSWEEYEANRARLRANTVGPGSDGRPPREGTALLQGLALCGRCGRRLSVRYAVRKGQLCPDYLCPTGLEVAQPSCQSLPGRGLDEAVAETVLDALTPAALEVALEVCQELEARRAEVDRLRRSQVERVREEAELAQRRYLLVRPENRLVADNLEREWNEKLAELARAEQEYQRLRRGTEAELSIEAGERIFALASDFPRVWKAATTSPRDRKRLLRLLIEDVTLLRHAARIDIEIRWKGGATTHLERSVPKNAADLYRTSVEIVEQVRTLAQTQTDSRIAHNLHSRGLRASRGGPFTPACVRGIRLTHEIPSVEARLRSAGWITVSGALAAFGLSRRKVRALAAQGLMESIRVNDKIFLKPADNCGSAMEHPVDQVSVMTNEMQYEA